MNIRYFFVKERVGKEITVEYCPTHLMITYFIKSLQGKALSIFCYVTMVYAHSVTLLTVDHPIKECVEKGNKIKMIEKSTVPCIEKELEKLIIR